MAEFEPKPQLSYLPIVTSEVTDRLTEQLGLDIDKKTASIISNIRTGEIKSPGNNLEQLATEVFSDLISSNLSLAKITNNVLSERMIPFEANGTLEGMMLVLKAFDYMKESDLLQRLGSLNSDDLALAQQTMERSFPKKDQTMSISQRLLTLPRIPETQIDLNECLKKAEKYSTSVAQNFRGGGSGYV